MKMATLVLAALAAFAIALGGGGPIDTVERADAACAYGHSNAYKHNTYSGSYGYGSRYPADDDCGPMRGFQRAAGVGTIPVENLGWVTRDMQMYDRRVPPPDVLSGLWPEWPFYGPRQYDWPLPPMAPQEPAAPAQPQAQPQGNYQPYLQQNPNTPSNSPAGFFGSFFG